MGIGRGGNRVFAVFVAGVLAATISASPVSPPQATFANAVAPVLENTCSLCHNHQLASGGFDASAFLDPSSLAGNREGWEAHSAQAPRRRDAAQGRSAAAGADEPGQVHPGEFDKADRNAKPDPGRVTARRLNRNEYANTIRDLLGVDFRAQKDFPTDDSGDGFDNIGDMLTISPVLMEKYMAAAERIASRAIAADPLPEAASTVEYASKDKRIRRVDSSTVEATHRVDFDGEYIVRFGLPGERAADAKPVMLGFWMDGKLLGSKMRRRPSHPAWSISIPTRKSRCACYAARRRSRVPRRLHRRRFRQRPDAEETYDNKKQQVPRFAWSSWGPSSPKAEPASRAQILICDPESGAGLRAKRSSPTWRATPTAGR